MSKSDKYRKQIRVVDDTPFSRKLGWGRCTGMTLDEAEHFCMALALEIKRLKKADESYKDALAAVARQNQVASAGI
jgi:hypothetical protein